MRAPRSSRQSVSDCYARRKAAGLCIDCGTNPNGGMLRCEACRIRYRKYAAKYARKTTSKRQQKQRDLRAAAIIAYGGPRCACCNETKEPVFLQIDHVDGDGAAHRKIIGMNMARWLERHNYPPGFQVLCTGCNYAKRHNKECPHQQMHREMFGKLAKLQLTY